MALRTLLVAFYLGLAVVACGRAALDGYELGDGGLIDAGADASADARLDGDAARDAVGDVSRDGDSDVDAGGCNAFNCPGGCCDLAGRCQTGNTLTACGSAGAQCEDCLTQGFDFCDAQRKTCARDVNACNAATCSDGCCRPQAPRCLSGESNQACGDNGGACAACPVGQACNLATHKCEAAPTCGPENCAGCCQGGICRLGQDQGACGVKGLACETCTPGEICLPMGAIGGLCTVTASCGPGNCPGCCIGNLCVAGNQNASCGAGGLACQNCTGQGAVCNQNKCQIPPPQCNAQNCPSGCCQGTQCVGGTLQTQCGIGGQACQNCTTQGRVCTSQQCVSACNAATCPNGCCNGNTCVTGSANTACGTGGVTCQNCSANGNVCQGKTCQPPPCSAATCPNGCCNGNTCVTGSANTACGTGGVACQNCTTQGNVCSAQKSCIPQCSAANCPGCCDSVGVCNAGFTGSKCGSGGATCANCTSQGDTCNITAVPRVCSSQPSNCPATYGKCPAGVKTTPVTATNACSAQNLADARAACAAGPNSSTCQSYFTVLETIAPACATCLENFHHPFNEGTGVFKCVAPFVNPACNINTGCATDCLTKSCSACPTNASRNQCENSVRNGGQCSDEYQSAGCFASGLTGAGAFCSPAQYQGNFGRWLEGVGLFYCAP